MRLSKLCVVVMGAGLLGACVADGEEEGGASTEVNGRASRYVVVFKSDAAPADASSRIAKAGGRLQRLVKGVGVASFEGTATAAAKLASDPSVLLVGPEHRYKLPAVSEKQVRSPAASVGSPTGDDFLYGLQWDIRRVNAPAVWARPATAVRPRVAVLDTGVASDHPDLAGQLCGDKAFQYCPSTNAMPTAAYPAYDSVIQLDEYFNWDGACTPAPVAYQSHGTHVSGTIAGKFGGGGIVGVAPDACVGAYKVFDRYRYTVDGVEYADYGAFDGPLFAAMVDAADSGYPVISMSLGGTLDLALEADLAAWEAWKRVTNYVNRKGTVIVAAEGNSELDLSGTLANIPSDLPNVVGVSATGTSNLQFDGTNLDAAPGSDVLAFYSNYGDPVDIAAPGGDCGPDFPYACVAEHLILSSYIFEEDVEFPEGWALAGSMGYAHFAGTSMATPHVAAVAGQVRAKNPTWTPGRTRAQLTSTAGTIGPSYLFGAGMVDADRATR